MTDKIKQTYLMLSTKAKLSIIMSILVMVLASSMAAFAVDPAIVVKWVSPVGSTAGAIGAATPLVRCNVADSADYLNPASIVAKLDGQTMSATLETYPVVGPSKTGTIQFKAPTLADGTHEAEVYIADFSGNQLTYKWSFTVVEKPKFSAITPAKFVGVPGGASLISMVITDNGTIDWTNLYFRINGIMRTPEIDEQTGLVVYRGPFPKGQVDVYVNAKDIKGNYESVGYWFYNDIGNPQFYNNKINYFPYTAFTNGLIITDGILRFEGDVSDYVNVNITSLTATLDGVPLNITVSSNGNTYDNKSLTHYKYSGVEKDGNHTLVLNVTDQCGNSNSLTRTFTVKSSPVISNVEPVQYGVRDLAQLISANVFDPNGSVVPESVVLTVDSVKVNHNYDSATNKVTYQTGQLSDESYHTVILTAADDSGNTTTKTWKFFTDTHNYPDMSDSNISNCNTCHPSFTALESHPLVFYADHHDTIYNECAVCHNYITQEAGCTICHGDPETGGDATGHGYTQDISYGPANYDSTYPVRVKINREVIDCVICHQPGAGTRTAAGVTLNNHDIPELHKYINTTDTSCNSCHAQSLTKEHARPGRVDKNGSAITCSTCHQSTNSVVVSAIANHRKNCDACHTVSDHSANHTWNDFDAKCQSCHINTLTTEHLSNEKTTSGKNLSCATCHGSGNKAVERSIASASLSCAGCHQTGHNLFLAAIAPSDIPQYPGFKWSTPIEISIFQGESTTPVGYESGQVVISNRLASVTVDQVWNYYNEQADTKMAAKGWTLKSGALAPGAVSFVAEYEKAGRLVTIRCYKSAVSDGSGPLSSTKIEIWYK